MANTFTGKRHDAEDFLALEVGEYGRMAFDKGNWYARCPDVAGEKMHANLTSHKVTEHEDGTITVAPSILVSSRSRGQEISWHGFIERGVWREC